MFVGGGGDRLAGDNIVCHDDGCVLRISNRKIIGDQVLLLCFGVRYLRYWKIMYVRRKVTNS